MLAKLPNTGHTQFLDRRGELPLDPCNVGKDRDKDVVLLCCQAVASWGQACTCAAATAAPPKAWMAPAPLTATSPTTSVSDSAPPVLTDSADAGSGECAPPPWLREVRAQVNKIAETMGISIVWTQGA